MRAMHAVLIFLLAAILFAVAAAIPALRGERIHAERVVLAIAFLIFGLAARKVRTNTQENT